MRRLRRRTKPTKAPQFPTFKVKVERMDAWWNVDKKLSPWFELKVGGTTKVEAGDFAYDKGERSGSTKVSGPGQNRSASVRAA